MFVCLKSELLELNELNVYKFANEQPTEAVKCKSQQQLKQSQQIANHGKHSEWNRQIKRNKPGLTTATQSDFEMAVVCKSDH